MIALLLLFPLPLVGILLIFRNRVVSNSALAVYASAHAILSVILLVHRGALLPYFRADDVNVLFLALLSVVFAATTIYLVGQFSRTVPAGREGHYSSFAAFLLLFVDSMNGALLATHLGLLWVFLEASTLTSVVLVNFDGTRRSLEAAWKYVFICSIGISLAFIGIILLGVADLSNHSLFFGDLYRAAPRMSAFWLRLAFAFILVGFGTKMGLAPVHSWLPDAHSEGPSPVSALLSGALLNVALFGIIRVEGILVAAGNGPFARGLLLTMGFLSLFVSAVFILGSTNYKRMLAYSSIEHMGIISIGLGVGGAGIFAGLLHMIGHSLTKSSFFLTAGNVHERSGSNEIESVQSLLRRDRITAGLVIASFLAVSGMPPFSTFLSEILLLKALIAGRLILTMLFVVLAVVILYGMGSRALELSFRQSDPHDAAPPVEPVAHGSHAPLSLWAYVPQIILLALAALLGVVLPAKVVSLIHGAAALIGG
ncbi:MAG TPA: proton-conducting transporter membrane subunit [Spirochaetia bacterium]|nr:proton-conducting transporter membrane subunit [Spirochaetia bacterium]